MEDLKKTIADNLIFYRKQKGLTQLDIAEKLNYSDKAVSKWERAEAVPDIFILKQIADFYGIKLDDLLSTDKKKREKLVRSSEQKARLVKIFVPTISCIFVWFLATLLYILPAIIIPQVTKTWLVFIYAIMINFILFVVFSSIWGNNILRCLSISGLIWTAFLAMCLTFSTEKIWLLLIVAIPLQIITILSFVFVKFIKDKDKEKLKEKEQKEAKELKETKEDK